MSLYDLVSRGARAAVRTNAALCNAAVEVAVRTARAGTLVVDACLAAANRAAEFGAWQVEVRNESGARGRPPQALNVVVRLWRELDDAYASHRAQVVLDFERWRSFGYEVGFHPWDEESRHLWFFVGPFAWYSDVPVPEEWAAWLWRTGEEWFGDTAPDHADVRKYDAIYKDRAIGWRLYRYEDTREPEWIFAWSWWECGSVGYTRNDWWRRQYINLTDLVWGPMEYARTPFAEYAFDVVMPERTYKWRAKEARLVCTRARWPWPIITKSIMLDAEKGEHIPFPGKGENAWDIGMDGLFGCGAPENLARTEMGAYVRSSVERERARRGFSESDAKRHEEVRALASTRACNPTDVAAAAAEKEIANE